MTSRLWTVNGSVLRCRFTTTDKEHLFGLKIFGGYVFVRLMAGLSCKQFLYFIVIAFPRKYLQFIWFWDLVHVFAKIRRLVEDTNELLNASNFPANIVGSNQKQFN